MEERIGLEISTLSKYIGRYLNGIGHLDDSLSGAQGLILVYLCENEVNVYQKDIEKYFNIRRSTATGIIRNLEKNGYIIRESVEADARLKKIVPTKKTHDTVNSFDAYVRQLEKVLLKDIGEEEIQVFRKVVQKMKLNLVKESKNG